MLKMFNKTRIRCPVGFYQKINTVCEEKCLKLTQRMSKIQKFSNFCRFQCNFWIISEKYYGFEVPKRLKLTNEPWRFTFEENFAAFCFKNIPERLFHHLCFVVTHVKFLKVFGVRMLENVQND